MRSRYKSITVDVDVDFCIDEFSTEDIIDELAYRLKNQGKEEVDVSKLIPLMANPDNGFSINSLIDQMKLEYVTRIFSDYSIDEFQKALPQKL